jgi:AcrR family transcriptional regulator
MKMQEKEHTLTRQRLLEAAGEVFAERGFRGACVRDICQKAQANIAAINYHFGNKERLYAAVLRHTYETALRKYPPTLGLSEPAGPQERLFAFVHSLLLRVLDSGRPAWHGKLMVREMAETTAAFNEIIQEMIEPIFERLKGIVAELVPSVSTDYLAHCCGSVIGQCLFYYQSRVVIQRLYPAQGYGQAEIESLARHITDFSLAGLAAKKQAE